MVDVDLVCRAVLTVPGMSGLHAGALGTAATCLPGRRIGGVALRAGGTEIHVVITVSADVALTAARVHAAVADLDAPQPVRVFVEAQAS